jgi:hypothetical protein
MIEVGMRFLGAFETHALQGRLLRMAHAALDLPLAVWIRHTAGHRNYAKVGGHIYGRIWVTPEVIINIFVQ